MQTIVDDMGNERVVVDPTAKPAKTKKQAAGGGYRPNDMQIAIKTLSNWHMPVAYQAGQFWSYDQTSGWTICTGQLQNLANDLRGANTEQSVMKILAAMCALPDLEHCEEYATYWERVSDRWEPFPVAFNQVLFANGLLTIQSNGDLEFQPTEHRVIYGPRVSIPYTDNLFDADCPEFRALVEHALPEEEAAYLQKVCGLILQPHVILRGQIVFWGVPHSGKTTLATAISTAPGGVRGQSAVSEERLIADKWATTMLVNKFASVSNDSEFTPKWESFMKQYTSGSFTAEAKFSKPCTVPTTAKLISTCNEMQGLKDLSGAASMRYRVFRFGNPIAESTATNQGEKMTAGYWAHPERRRGIVCWMLNGLIEAIVHGLVEPESMRQTKAEAIAESNPLIDFLNSNVEREEGAFLACSDLNAALGFDQRHAGAKHVKILIERIYKVKKIKKRLTKTDNPVWGYDGLKLI